MSDNQNLVLKFANSNDDSKGTSICELFNKVSKNDLSKFTLDFIYDMEFQCKNNFDWNNYLSTEEPYECEIYYQSIKIGTIQFLHLKDKHFFNVIYEKTIEHTEIITEFDICDPYYHVSQFTHDNIKTMFQLGYNHHSNEINKGKCFACHGQKKFNCIFSCSFNAIVLDYGYLNFIQINRNDWLPDGHEIEYQVSEGNFFNYKLKEATFEDSIKSLLLIHLIVNKSTNGYITEISKNNMSSNGTNIPDYQSILNAVNNNLLNLKNENKDNQDSENSGTNNTNGIMFMMFVFGMIGICTYLAK